MQNTLTVFHFLTDIRVFSDQRPTIFGQGIVTHLLVRALFIGEFSWWHLSSVPLLTARYKARYLNRNCVLWTCCSPVFERNEHVLDIIAVLRMLEVPVQISQSLCFVGFNVISYVAQCTVFRIFGLTKIPFLVSGVHILENVFLKCENFIFGIIPLNPS